jgi:hypothetical protein
VGLFPLSVPFPLSRLRLLPMFHMGCWPVAVLTPPPLGFAPFPDLVFVAAAPAVLADCIRA